MSRVWKDGGKINALKGTGRFGKIGLSTFYEATSNVGFFVDKTEFMDKSKIIGKAVYIFVNKLKGGKTIKFKFSETKSEIGFMHILGHFFTTNIQGKGVDLRYIQELLGYKSSKTIEIYTHITTRNLSTIKNPFDVLFKGAKI